MGVLEKHTPAFKNSQTYLQNNQATGSYSICKINLSMGGESTTETFFQPKQCNDRCQLKPESNLGPLYCMSSVETTERTDNLSALK